MTHHPVAPRNAASRVAFSLIELLVVIGIIAVLAGILLPVVASVQESGRSTKCLSNLRQIGAAMDLYANENNNCYPPLEEPANTLVNWDTYYINPYLPERITNGRQSTLFICPDASYKGDVNSDLSRTYSATECMVGPNNDWTAPSSRARFVSMTGTLVLFDAMQSGANRFCAVEVTWKLLSAAPVDLQPNATTSTYLDYRHRNAFHGLFADGHVDTIARLAAASVINKQMWTGHSQ